MDNQTTQGTATCTTSSVIDQVHCLEGRFARGYTVSNHTLIDDNTLTHLCSFTDALHPLLQILKSIEEPLVVEDLSLCADVSASRG